jgi:prevent-host-death family protein
MIRMGVRELKNGLSRALRQVREGETIEVTEHGRPVARLVRAWTGLGSEGPARLIPPESEGDLLDLWPPPALEPGRKTGSSILAEMRAGER